MLFRLVTCSDKAPMFCCAASMTARRASSCLQLFGRRLRAGGEILADALADGVEPLGQAFLDLRTGVGKILADPLQPSEHLDLCAHQLFDLLFGAAMALQLGLRLQPAFAAGAHEQCHRDHERKGAGDHRPGDRKSTKRKENRVHHGCIA